MNIKRGQGINPKKFKREKFTQFQSWLGETKGIEGCPLNCAYCFFQLDGLTPTRPVQKCPPELLIQQIKSYYTYLEKMPIHFGSQTDIFSTSSNIKYYSQLLKIYGKSSYPNPLIFITKSKIPESFIKISKKITQKVIFYISYSSLAGTGLEPAINEKHQCENFMLLHKHNVLAVHYWRPFFPQNSTLAKMKHILKHVSKYATASVVNGLRLNDGIKNNIVKFWPELKKYNFDYSKLGEVWPAGARKRLHDLVKTEYSDYPVFFGNTACSVSNSLNLPDMLGLYKGRMCLESNCMRRDLCAKKNRIPSKSEVRDALKAIGIDSEKAIINKNKIIIRDKIETEQLVYLRARLVFQVVSNCINYSGGHNWANINDDVKITEI